VEHKFFPSVWNIGLGTSSASLKREESRKGSGITWICERDELTLLVDAPYLSARHGFNVIHSGTFSSSPKVLWPTAHPSLSKHSSRSKLYSNSASISRISWYAKLIPMQLRGPQENGWRALFLSDAYSGKYHRSGMNSSAFFQLSG
jgi:hypothetical protein